MNAHFFDVTVSDSRTVGINAANKLVPMMLMHFPGRPLLHTPVVEWWVEICPLHPNAHGLHMLMVEVKFSIPVDGQYRIDIKDAAAGKRSPSRLQATKKLASGDHPSTSQSVFFCWKKEKFDINEDNFVVNIDVEINRPTDQQLPVVSEQMWLLQDGPKVALSVDGISVEISKKLLMAISPVFNAMFSCNGVEAATNCVLLKDFDIATLQAFADYCNGNISKMPVHELIETLWFAEKYDIKDLVDYLKKYFLSNLTVFNVLDVTKYAVYHSEHQLKDACLKFFCRHIIEVKRLAAPEDKNVFEFLSDLSLKTVQRLLSVQYV